MEILPAVSKSWARLLRKPPNLSRLVLLTSKVLPLLEFALLSKSVLAPSRESLSWGSLFPFLPW